jgi:hypothetical protein
LALDETEVGVVHKIVDLYLNGDRGRTLGMLGSPKNHNRLSITFRGRTWSKKKIDDILKDRSYIGEHISTKRTEKTNSLSRRKSGYCALLLRSLSNTYSMRNNGAVINTLRRFRHRLITFTQPSNGHFEVLGNIAAVL